MIFLELVALWGCTQSWWLLPQTWPFCCRQLSEERQDTAVGVKLLDQYRPIPAQAESLANWTDEDGRCGGQHFEQAVAVKANAL